jgi:hypothetical protein
MISEVRRFYYRVTRENIAGFLWTLAWTIPITVFIWAYAESESEQLDQDQSVRIEVRSRDPSKIVTLLEPKEAVITCDLGGPRSNLDRFKQLMLNPDTPPITIELDTRRMPDQLNIPTLEYLIDNPRFREAGVTISNAKPVNLVVSVDTVAKVTLPVRPPANLQIRKATFDPPTVRVTGPTKVVSHTEVVADLSSIPDLDQPGAKTATVQVVTEPSEPSVTCDPKQVKVSLTIAEEDKQTTLQNIPIWIAAPPDMGYSISLTASFAPPFKVAGPQEEIDELQKGTVSPRAVLEVGIENARNPGPLPLKVEGLPPDVHVVGSPPEVGFTATPQSH